MKQRKRFMSVLTVYTASMLFAAGFAGQTAANQSRSLAQENGVYAQGGETMAAVIESVSKDAVDETIATAKAAKAAAEEEAKRKAEEEARRAEEEAKRAAEEAARAQIQAEEQQLMASIIFCEAGNQPYEGQVAVGAVIMNRVKSGVYPDSISEVIYQPGQFGPAMTGWLDTVRASNGYTQTAMQAAADAMAGVNPVGDCLYFGNGSSGMQIGDHFFY